MVSVQLATVIGDWRVVHAMQLVSCNLLMVSMKDSSAMTWGEIALSNSQII